MTEPALTYTRRELSGLVHYPGNARRGDVEAVRESLRTNGQFRPLLVQVSTSHVLTGNHTLDGMLAEGWDSADVALIDCDDDTARRIVIADNRTSDLGGYDERALADLLREIGDDLTGTGFDQDDFDDLLASIEEADAIDPPQPTPGAPIGATGAYGSDGDGSNVRQTPSYAEYQAQYSSRATRFMALNYPLPQYGWIVDRLSKIAEDEGVDNFAEAVLRLVEARTGETAPPLEDGAAIGDGVPAEETAPHAG